MRSILFISALFLSLILPAFSPAQTDVARLEFDNEAGAVDYGAVPMGERGLAVLNETAEFTGEGRKGWNFTIFDTLLQESWHAMIPVVYGTEFKGHAMAGDNLCLFFLNTSRIKSGIENFQVTVVNFGDSAFYHTTGALPDQATFVEFHAWPGLGVVGLNLKNEKAAAYLINFETGQATEHLFDIDDQSVIEDVAFGADNQSVAFTVSSYVSRRHNGLHFIRLDKNGASITDLRLETLFSDKFLHSARVFDEPGGEAVLIGTYGNFSARLSSSEEYSGKECAGLFVTRLDSTGQKFMNYYNFLELKTIASGLRSRDFYRAQKKRVKETSEASLNYEMILHDIIRQDSLYTVMVEAYYPEFRTVSDVSYDYWGRPITQTYTVFEGFKYFSAILSAFDVEGNLVWDNTIEMKEIITFERVPLAGYHFDGDPVLLFYVQEDEIAYKVFLEEVEVVGTSFTQIDTSEAGDQVVEEDLSVIEHWYGNNFLCMGSQAIRNNLKAGDKRNVFFVNKISLE
jgi:hypothetical protein